MDWINEIREYTPYNEEEERDKELFLKAIDSFGDLLYRENPIAHITCSAFIVNGSRDKTVMIYHNIYKSWAWVGGHADGDDNLEAVALREVKEETGLDAKIIKKGIFTLEDIHVAGHYKKGKYVSSHLHLNVTYLVEADENDSLKVKPDENSGVKWVDIDKMTEVSEEPDMIKIYQKLIDKLKKEEY